MFVPLGRLLRRGPASRRDELVALTKRLRAERRAVVTDEERALALRVQAAKREVVGVVGAVTSCGGCATRQPWPVGGYAGGACCAGDTPQLFDEHELAALVHAGTRAADLVAPPSEDAHAGCAFRGARGCSLALDHRPARCTHYVCDGLRAELHRAGKLDATEAALAALNTAMREFTAAHRARLDREVLAPLVAALEDATQK